MDSCQPQVRVKRVEKIPSGYYVQPVKTIGAVKTKVLVETSDSLLGEYKRLSDGLHLKPVLPVDYSNQIGAKIKNALAFLRSRGKALILGTLAFLTENAKRLAVSSGVSLGVAGVASLLLFSTCSLGYTITVDGNVVGTAKTRLACEELIKEINQEIDYVYDTEFVPLGDIRIARQVIPKGAFTENTLLKEQLKATSPDMLPAYGVYVNNELVFALTNEETALEVLAGYKNNFTKGKENITADFCQDISVRHSFVPKTSLKTAESAMVALNRGKIADYTVPKETSLQEVADFYNISIDSIIQNNVIKDMENIEGLKLKIPTGNPLITVKTVERKTITEDIPYKTLEQEDATKYQGTSFVTQEGKPGSREIDAVITAINGVETEKTILSEKILSTSIDQVIAYGTKERPSPYGTGTLTVPTSGTLTSRFGSRWGRTHEGIDFGADTGTKIYAADNGTVVYAQFNNGGYGYLVEIDHGNGIMTYYGHCNELFVKEGDVVAKGDVIATVGNTGRSTGPHLHFEVRQNGEAKDPLNYLNSVQ